MGFRPSYQRSVGGSRTVDTGPPRTNTGLTGLGAVGGPTGVGAGALRVIVEFLTTYDAKEIEQLERDLDRLQAKEAQYQQFLSRENATRAKEDKRLADLTTLRQRANVTFTKAQRAELLNIRDLERSRDRASQQEAKNRAKILASQTGFNRNELRALINEDRTRQRINERRVKYAAAHANAERQVHSIMKQQEATATRLGFLQNLKANVGPKLGSLALGAVGGVFGGAIVGLGFAGAQLLIDAIGNALTKIVDPAKEAREALSGVAESIQEIADSKGISTLEAAQRVLKDFGLGGVFSSQDIASIPALDALIGKTGELVDLLSVLEHQSRLTNDALFERGKALLSALGGTQEDILSLRRVIFEGVDPADGSVSDLTRTVYELALSAQRASASVNALAGAEQRIAAAGDIAAASQNRLVAAVQRVSSQRITGLQDQLDSLGGPSQNTQNIINQINGVAEAQAQANYQQQLAAIGEQRYLTLLEQRIRFQGQSVNLANLSARAQIVAINAQISALQRMGSAEKEALDALNSRIRAARRADQEQDKRDQKALEAFDDRIAKIRQAGDEQDRFNKLLDLQYRLSQNITRQEGESISDFLQRRANETRQLLAERDSLGRENQVANIQAERDRVAAIQEVANERREASIEAMELEAEQLQATIENIEKAKQAQIEALNEQRERLELEVRLQELAEQEKRLQEQETSRQQAKELQLRLEKSQARDQKELESRRNSLEQQIEAEKKRAEEATKWLDIGEQERLRGMLQHAATQSDVQAVIGQVLGAQRAYSDLQAYLRGIGLTPAQISEILNPLKNLVDYAQGRLNSLRNSPPRIVPAGTPFAKGGAFILSNAMNRPFGMDIRTGEQGQEIGVVLSNKVARILQEQSRDRIPAMNVTVNRSNDPWRDGMRTKRMIRDTVEEMLG